MTAVNIPPLLHFLATIRRQEQLFVCIVSLVCLKDRGGGDFSIGSDVHLLPLARWDTIEGACGPRPGASVRSAPCADSAHSSRLRCASDVHAHDSPSRPRPLPPSPHSFDDADARAGRIADDRYANHDVGPSCSPTSSVTVSPRRYASTTTSNGISITTTPTGYSATRRQRPWANATVGVRSDSTSTLLQMTESRTGRSNIWSSKWSQMGQTDAGTSHSVTKRGPGPM